MVNFYYDQAVEETVDFVNNLLKIPPGFETGMEFVQDSLATIEDEPKNIQVRYIGTDDLKLIKQNPF